jgi:hypothetical protein
MRPRWKKLARDRETSREGEEASMDLGEKVPYQQIHPAKLPADVSGSLVSTYLMWRHKFVAALLSAFGPAIMASVLVIRYADLEKRKHSPFGRYMRRYMNRRVEAWRFFGQVVIWVGAWHRVGKLVLLGWAIVFAAWASGILRKPTN